VQEQEAVDDEREIPQMRRQIFGSACASEHDLVPYDELPDVDEETAAAIARSAAVMRLPASAACTSRAAWSALMRSMISAFSTVVLALR
jgi:hypothetical protein